MELSKLYDLFLHHSKIVTDTRKIEPNTLFFGLKGSTFNGNTFAAQALAQGAAFAVIDDPDYQKDDRYILVDDVLSTLQALAAYHRDQLKIPIIGITGTNGKTTTKELIFSVLIQKYNVYATQGNLNNHIGVPLSLLSIDVDKEIGIIEMGANHIGEIDFLCRIAKPTVGLITNVGKAHLEGFGSFEGVKKAKGELYAWLEDHEGVVFLQGDNDHLLSMINGRTFRQVITYGPNKGNDISGELLATSPTLSLSWESIKAFGCYADEVNTQLTGAYNLENILASVALGLYFGLSVTEINQGIATYMPTNNRSQLTTTEKNKIISDYYNANASSMYAALENLDTLPDQKKAVVLGDMFELGKESANEHKRIVAHAENMKLERCIFIGKAFFGVQQVAMGANSEFYETIEAAKEALSDRPITDTLILLKASRGMAFEQLLPYL